MIKKKLDLLIILVGLGFILVLFLGFIPMNKEIQSYQKDLKIKNYKILELKKIDKEQQNLKRELEKQKEKLEKLKKLFAGTPSDLLKVKSHLKKKAENLGIKEKYFFCGGTEKDTRILGTWEGDFNNLWFFLLEMNDLPFLVQVKKFKFQVEESLVMELSLKIPMKGDFLLHEF